MQAYVVEFANILFDLGPDGQVIYPSNMTSLGRAQEYQCSNQRIRNTGRYQTFSLAGLLVILCIGVPIIVVSFALEFVLVCCRGTKHNQRFRETTRNNDWTTQLLRMALMSGGYREGWAGPTDRIPVHDTSKKWQDTVPLRPMSIDSEVWQCYEMVPAYVEDGDDKGPSTNTTPSNAEQPRISIVNEEVIYSEIETNARAAQMKEQGETPEVNIVEETPADDEEARRNGLVDSHQQTVHSESHFSLPQIPQFEMLLSNDGDNRQDIELLGLSHGSRGGEHDDQA